MPKIKVTAHAKAAKNYRKLFQLARPTMKKGDSLKLRRAFLFALTCYEEKKDGAKHTRNWQPIEIARIVAESMGLGITPIICVLLYGLPADTIRSEVKKIFGAKVTQILQVLGKLEGIVQLNAASSTQISEALTIDLKKNPQVALIKLAENLQKMRTLASLPHEEQAEITSQAKYIYIPIAHRLGLNAIKAELEDLYLKCTNAKVYDAIKEQIKSSRDVRKRFIRRFKKPIQESLKRKKFPFSIKARTKSITSIRNKMKALDLPFEQIHDVFAVRIVLNVPASRENVSCWQAYEVVTSLYKVHPSKFRNFLRYPRINGYQSLHATVMSREGVWVEVQVRTKRMDEIAEKGNAAHWKYKKDSHMEYILGPDIWLRQVRTLLKRKSQDSDEVIDAVDASLQINKTEALAHEDESEILPAGAGVLVLDRVF
jgi:GTP diphosphokinase / guanosine-3',5'-bis(diphosphate) 3'-diphosphatase